MKLKNYLSKNFLVTLIANSFIWWVIHTILIKYLPKGFELPSLSNLLQKEHNIFSLLKNPLFWSTSAGVSIYVFFEIFIVSGIVYLICKLYKTGLSFGEIIKIVVAAYCIFLLQYISEIIFINLHPGYFKIIRLENFSLFSISYFLTASKIGFNHVFNYMFQTISVFEIIFWLNLSFGLSKAVHQKFITGFKIVGSSYIPVLIIWPIFISFLTLINSH